MGRRLEQRQVQVKTLVAVLLIEDNDRKELLQRGMTNTRTKSGPPLIGTLFTDDGASVVLLGSHNGVVLN